MRSRPRCWPLSRVESESPSIFLAPALKRRVSKNESAFGLSRLRGQRRGLVSREPTTAAPTKDGVRPRVTRADSVVSIGGGAGDGRRATVVCVGGGNRATATSACTGAGCEGRPRVPGSRLVSSKVVAKRRPRGNARRPGVSSADPKPAPTAAQFQRLRNRSLQPNDSGRHFGVGVTGE